MSNKNPTWYRISLLSVLGGAVLFSGITIFRSFLSDTSSRAGLITDVIALIHEQHVDQPSLDQLTEAALGAIAQSVDDPFTIYVPPAEVAEFEKQLTGAYSGIGASIEIRDGVLTIISPLEDSPAYKAGILPDDRVVAIEGEPTLGLTANEAVSRLVGESGTPVAITIERDSDRFDITLTREDIVSRTVRGFLRDPADPESWRYSVDDQIAYIRVNQFTMDTAAEFRAALDQAIEEIPDISGLIIDLRGNPGGLMNATIDIADRFLQQGTIVAAAGPSVGTTSVEARQAEDDSDLSLVVLIDGASASASEILAGALKGNGRAVVVGTRSFGKGSVQQVWPLLQGAGGEIKVTQAYYKVPTAAGGLSRVHRKPDDIAWGIDPSPWHYVAMTTDEIIAARDVRRGLDLLVHDTSESISSMAFDELEDAQFTAAIETLRSKLDTGEWGRPGKDLPTQDDITTDELTQARETRRFLKERLLEIDELIASLNDAEPSESTEDPEP